MESRRDGARHVTAHHALRRDRTLARLTPPRRPRDHLVVSPTARRGPGETHVWDGRRSPLGTRRAEYELARRLSRRAADARRARARCMLSRDSAGTDHSGCGRGDARRVRLRRLGQIFGGTDSSQYSSLAQVDKTNVGRLKVAWTYPTGENYLFNPLIVGTTMYVLAKGRFPSLSTPRRDASSDASERRPGRHARHELLAQCRRVRRAIALHQRGLSDRDRCEIRQRDRELRRQGPSTCASASTSISATCALCKRATLAVCSRTSSSCRCRPAEPAMRPPPRTFMPTTFERARSPGPSTPSRGPASPAPRLGRPAA